MEALCPSSQNIYRTFGVIISFILQDNDERCRIKEKVKKSGNHPIVFLEYNTCFFRYLNEV